MSDERPVAREPDEPAQPVLRSRRSLSPIWAVPIVAVLVALWLAYKANSDTGQNRGPDRFDTVRPEVPPNRHAESTFSPHERPIRRLC